MTERGVRRRHDIPFDDRTAARLFPFLCLAWLILRFLPGTASPPPAVLASFSVVRAAPSVETGRWEVSGLPDPSEDPLGIFRAPEVTAALARLEGRIAGANEELARYARRLGARIESFPQNGVTGIRLAGELVPFHDGDAERLAAAGREGATRPWASLETIRELVDARLSEPEEGILVDESIRRRELMRTLRDTQDVLEDGEREAVLAIDEFRRDALDVARRAQGPFRRQGAGRILEIVLAALLGATLRDVLRRGPGPVPTELSLAFAPVLATAVVLLAEGTPFVSVDPVRGLSLSFLPVSFALGFGCSALLRIASRLDRVFSPEPREATAPPAPAAPPPLPEPRPPARERLAAARTPAATEREIPEPSPRSEPAPRPPRPGREPRPGFFPKRIPDFPE